jgi:hypothetical protein
VFIEFRRAARTACIAIAVAALWNSFAQLTVALGLPRVPWGLIAASTATLLFDLPLFYLLLLLSRGEATPVLSKRQQGLVRILAGIRILAAVEGLHWRMGSNRVPSGNFWLWFSQSSVRFVISEVVSVLWAMAFVVFLFALARQTGPVAAVGEHPRLVRNVALTAAIVGGLVVILSVGVGFEMMALGGTAGDRVREFAMLRSALFALPGTFVPWIVRASVRTSGPAVEADLL